MGAFELSDSMAASFAAVCTLLPNNLFLFEAALSDDCVEVSAFPLSSDCTFSFNFCTGNAILLPPVLFFSFIPAVEPTEVCLFNSPTTSKSFSPDEILLEAWPTSVCNDDGD